MLLQFIPLHIFFFCSPLGSVPPISSLRLLVPPLRLMSAFMWKIAQQQHLEHYGKLEEFVSLVTRLVPEVLTSRQKATLVMGLRAKVSREGDNKCTDYCTESSRTEVWYSIGDWDSICWFFFFSFADDSWDVPRWTTSRPWDSKVAYTEDPVLSFVKGEHVLK